MKSMAGKLLEKLNVNESSDRVYVDLVNSGVNKKRRGQLAVSAKGNEVPNSVVLDDTGNCILWKDNSGWYNIVKVDPLTDEVSKINLFKDEFDSLMKANV